MLVPTNTDLGRSSTITDMALIMEEKLNILPVQSENEPLLHTGNSGNGGLISDEMGPEVVQVLVGSEKKVFTVHKNLLLATGDSFVNAFDPKKNHKGRITMSTKSPDVFKLFIDMIYTRKVPAFTSVMTEQSKIFRLKGLCQLYVFAEELELKHIILNQIFDRVQDGFFLLDKLPDVSFISSIYRNTSASSQLRKFLAACLVHQVRSNLDFEIDNITELFKSNEDIIKDFLAMVHYFVPGQDPRIRNCEGRPGCVECVNKAADFVRPPGVWPCVFHVHKSVEGMESGEDEVCHLWYR